MGVNFELLAGLTENMYFYPMDKLSDVYYNGEDIAKTVDLSNCVEFGTMNGQELLIYDIAEDGRKHICFAGGIERIFDVPFVSYLSDKSGEVYNADYDTVYDKMKSDKNVVMNYLLNVKGHPEYCYSHDMENNCTIIKWGEGGYYKTDFPQGKYDDYIVDEVNMDRNITPAERNAMESCSIAAQDNPDLDWDKHYAMCLELLVSKKIKSSNENTPDNEPIIPEPTGGRK